MIDSCSPRKLEPGFAQTYSNPSDLITSTMKSEPVRSTVSTSTLDGVPTSASGDIGGGAPGATRGGTVGAPTTAEFVASIAAPAAAPFRKSRRGSGTFLNFAMASPPKLPSRLIL